MFASLRANDLIWPYVVQGYLKGQAPPAFDLLFWNSDDTNLPGPMFCWYVRNTYLENKLREPGATVQCGEPVDLGAIDVPTFLYASKEDHIVPWKTAYASTQLLPGDTTFVLGASGHIAGVINPPAKNKRNYWTLSPAPGPRTRTAPTARPASTPTRTAGSRAPRASPAVGGRPGPTGSRRIPGRRSPRRKKLGNAEFTPIEDAPGSYVKEKAS